MTENAPRACVVGWPIGHSRSPLIHNHWLRALGLPGAYGREAVSAEAFPAFLARIGEDGLRGANVTAPHKEAAFAACDSLSDSAKATGAVNTLWREGGSLCGDNSDVAGFAANLDERAEGWDKHGEAAVVIGAGGAALSVVHCLLQSGFQRVLVVNRSPERAQRLAARFGERVRSSAWQDLPAFLPGADLLVNASLLGMVGQDPLELDVEALAPHAVVADVVYVPLQTHLIRDAEARGLIAVEGLGMLLHQATAGFERWFGVRPEVTPELRALVEADVRNSELKR